VLEAGGSRILQHRPVVYQTVQGQRREISGRYKLLDARTAVFVVSQYDTRLPLVIDPILSYSTFLGGSKGENGWAIAVDANGSAYVAGETLSVFKNLPVTGFQTNLAGGNKHGGDAFVAKLNPAGNGFEYLTYLGGNKLDGAVGIAIDASGNAYVAGYTDSSDFPVTSGVFQTNISGKLVPRTSAAPSDAFITKLNPSGSALVYSTYLGGKSFDSAVGIAVDAAGSAYVVGYTESAAVYRITNRVCRMVCTNSICGTTLYKTNVSKSSGFFLASFETNLLRLTVSGPPPFITNAVEEVILTTLLGVETLDPGFPITNALQIFHGGARDIFVSKLSPDGSAAIYSTFLGGSGDDLGSGIAVDAAGNATISGWSESLDFPVTNAFQPVLGGRADAVIAKFDPSGTSLIYSTYLGGTGNDVAFRVAVDAAGAAYVTGAKASADFPATPAGLNRGGVFKSTDAGALWAPSSVGLTHTVIEALVLDPANSSVIYAGTLRGVFRSADAGATWEPRVTGLDNHTVHALAFNSTGTTLLAGTGAGLFLSTNSGSDWMFGVMGLSSRAVFSLAATPGALLAGTRGSGVWRSTNDALSWKAANSGLGNLNVNALAATPLNSQVVYAATDAGVFKSTNNGMSWRGSSTGMTSKKSHALLLDPGAPAILYVGTTKGLFKSSDAGATWSSSGAGLGSSNVTALALNPGVTSTIFAGTTNGLFKSTDAGATWSTNSSGLAPLFVKTLLVDPTNTALLYAGIRSSNTFGGSNDVFVTKFLPDGSGLSYSIAFGGKKADQGWAIAVDAAGRAYVTGSTDSTNFPVVNATTPQQMASAGKTDVFCAEIDADGASLLFSIYLGGKKRDLGYGIAVDGAGSVYLTGRTESSGFPTNAAVQSELAGHNDAFVMKVIPEAMLRMARTSQQVILSWAGPMPGFFLEGAENMTGPWARVSQTAVFKNGSTSVTLPSSSVCRFFRLKSARP
ncbi:MAG: hypothetical protein QOF48_1883, partial [Verrucomicrobiota bacterium]